MSAPSNNPATSGSFDFPPASRDSTTASRGSRHLLNQRIREFNTIRAQHEAMIPTDPHHQPPRRSLRTPAPLSAIERSQARPLNRRHRAGPVSDSPTSTLMDRLHNATSEADSLLDQPIPRIGSADISTREYLGEAQVNRQRKRRKMDHQERPLGVGMNGFRYGYRGSVAPGPLKMEIVSCDGGLLHTVEVAQTGRDYLPDNVLRNDRSVYCTNANRCNIILRHREETTFTLSKIIVKAPATGFTAPIQEGLIFISMTSDDLLPSTAPYKIRNPSPPRDEENQRPPSRRRDSTSRSIPPPISHLSPLPPSSSEYNPYSGVYVSEQRCSPSATAKTTPPPPLVPGFEITTHCGSPSSDEEEPSSAATLADRQRRDQAPPPYIDHSSGSEDVEDGIEHLLEARALGISPRMLRGEMRAGGGRGGRRATPSEIECRIPGTDPKAQQGEAVERDGDGIASGDDQQQNQNQRPQHQRKSPNPNILPPHARFFIEHEESVVSVKFEPAVTGKFILLKLWSPSRDQNIDIQSIIVHGFAGPRCFPGTALL